MGQILQIGWTSEHLGDPQRRRGRLLVLARGVFPAVIDAALQIHEPLNEGELGRAPLRSAPLQQPRLFFMTF